MCGGGWGRAGGEPVIYSAVSIDIHRSHDLKAVRGERDMVVVVVMTRMVKAIGRKTMTQIIKAATGSLQSAMRIPCPASFAR